MPAGSISDAINTMTREMSATLRGPLPTARGGAAVPAMGATAATGAAAEGAASGLVKLTAVLTVLKNTVNVVTGEITAASKLAAAGAAEARGELSKALTYRAQTPGWFMRGLSAIPIVGGMAKAGHEALNLRAKMPEYIEVAAMLEQHGHYRDVESDADAECKSWAPVAVLDPGHASLSAADARAERGTGGEAG